MLTDSHTSAPWCKYTSTLRGPLDPEALWHSGLISSWVLDPAAPDESDLCLSFFYSPCLMFPLSGGWNTTPPLTSCSPPQPVRQNMAFHSHFSRAAVVRGTWHAWHSSWVHICTKQPYCAQALLVGSCNELGEKKNGIGAKKNVYLTKKVFTELLGGCKNCVYST